MFGHLKAEDFVNLLDDADLPMEHRSHIDTCERCRATWEFVRSAHAEMSAMDTEIPEPDWTQFRSCVRDELLSRSVQRETTVRRWTGWTVRPAMAWALSLLLAVGLTTVTVLWKTGGRPAPSAVHIEATFVEPTAEISEAGPEKSLFDEVGSLGEEQQERLRQMLESEVKTSSHKQ
jgi:hypothetical protein